MDFQVYRRDKISDYAKPMNTYDIAIRLTDGSRKIMTVRATTANAAERMVKERYPVSYRETESIQIKNK